MNEKFFVLVIKHEYKMYVYKKGKEINTYDIAISQNPKGHKIQDGDNKTPEESIELLKNCEGHLEGNMERI